MSEDYSRITIRNSAKDRAEDEANAKAFYLRRHEDEIREFRGSALDKISLLVNYSEKSIPVHRVRDILKQLDRAIKVSADRYESIVKQIEEAYK
jgi:uncharacterized protein (UPF0248 family)